MIIRRAYRFEADLISASQAELRMGVDDSGRCVWVEFPSDVNPRTLPIGATILDARVMRER